MQREELGYANGSRGEGDGLNDEDKAVKAPKSGRPESPEDLSP